MTVTDVTGRTLDGSSVARPPTGPPPDALAYVGPSGERADWKWYEPFAAREARDKLTPCGAEPCVLGGVAARFLYPRGVDPQHLAGRPR